MCWVDDVSVVQLLSLDASSGIEQMKVETGIVT